MESPSISARICNINFLVEDLGSGISYLGSWVNLLQVSQLQIVFCHFVLHKLHHHAELAITASDNIWEEQSIIDSNFNDWCFWDQKTFLMPHTYVRSEKLEELVLMFFSTLKVKGRPWTSQKDILFYYFWKILNSWIKIKKTFIELIAINDRLLFWFIITGSDCEFRVVM